MKNCKFSSKVKLNDQITIMLSWIKTHKRFEIYIRDILILFTKDGNYNKITFSGEYKIFIWYDEEFPSGEWYDILYSNIVDRYFKEELRNEKINDILNERI